eukprot:CAMPEP_0178414026 /NCGR_PEP_ID=MMETSP0689_2-20121128/22826_1 /TAXON_ID=160604 /ORGANISM="Amphidinium massartii, Strain CS-259" /LENGTH=361 /DNA_ID=CAMNT_0020035307 /DNA_START=54 /DNA_END=1136 /DNA_ORIENTATION=-
MSHLGFALSRGRLTPAKGMKVGSKLLPQWRKDAPEDAAGLQDPVPGVPGVERPLVFLDVAIDGADVGRIVCELFSDVAPKTVANFLALCKGESGLGQRGKPLHYRGCVFHRISTNSAIYAGDITHGTGKGGDSIYGPEFDDENFALRHSRPGVLSMANKGRPNTNDSQFMICTAPQPNFDLKHVVFGIVVQGMEVVKRVEALGSAADGQVQSEVSKNIDELKSFRPTRTAHIKDCGEMQKENLKRAASLALADAPGNERKRANIAPTDVGPKEIQLLHMVKKHKDMANRDTPRGPAQCTSSKAKTTMESLRKRLMTSVSMRQTFVELARDHSDSSSFQEGGELGMVSRGDLDAELEDMVFA